LVIDNVHFDKNAVSEVVMNDGKYSGEKQPVKNMYISEEDQIVELMFDDVNYIDPDTKDLFYDPVKGTHAEKKEMIKLEYDNVNFVKPDADKKQIERFNVTSKYADMKAGVLRDAKNSHLGVPYKAGSYTTETSGEENIRTKSLGTPYTIRTKLQEEAIRRGY
jgi:hypothetical protein